MLQQDFSHETSNERPDGTGIGALTLAGVLFIAGFAAVIRSYIGRHINRPRAADARHSPSIAPPAEMPAPSAAAGFGDAMRVVR